MIRDASEEGNDGVILEGYTVTDLDEDAIKKYRNRFSSRVPDYPWNALNNEEFKEMIGELRLTSAVPGKPPKKSKTFYKPLFLGDLNHCFTQLKAIELIL